MKTFLVIMIVSGIVGIIFYKIGEKKGYNEATIYSLKNIEKIKKQCNSDMEEIGKKCIESMNRIKEAVN